MSLVRYANYPHAHNYAAADFSESESMDHMCACYKLHDTIPFEP